MEKEQKENLTKKKKVKEIKKKVNNKPKVNKEEEKLKKENQDLNDKVLRLSAEMQNMRRRYDEEMARICKYEGEELILKILTIVDNFERAIMLDSNLTDELSKFLDGFKMIYGNLKNILEASEVKEIDCLKQAFDPNTMEAVLTVHEENTEPGIVLDVLQKGYTYKDKVIRHAMVRVSE